MKHVVLPHSLGVVRNMKFRHLNQQRKDLYATKLSRLGILLVTYYLTGIN